MSSQGTAGVSIRGSRIATHWPTSAHERDVLRLAREPLLNRRLWLYAKENHRRLALYAKEDIRRLLPRASSV